MNRKLKFVMGALCVGIILAGTIFAAELGGEEILAKVDAVMDSPATVLEATMTTYNNGSEKSSRMLIYTKKNNAGKNRTLIQYLYPPADKGTRFLSLGSVDQMWMYLPKVEKLIRIAGSMVKQSMMNSSFSYEDLMDRNDLGDDYTAQIVGNTQVDGIGCQILLLKAKKGNAHYRQMKLYVRPDNFIPVKEEFFSGGGSLIKDAVEEGITTLGGRVIPTKITFRDLSQKNNQTVLTIKNAQFNAALPDRYFTQQYLEKGQ